MGQLNRLLRIINLFGAAMGVVFAVVVAFSVSAQEQEFAGKKVVHLLQEPRHRTVHQDGDIYLLDVQINAGDTSFPHIHDSAILLTFISSATGPQYGRVSSNTDYATQSHTHEVSNPGPGLMRIIALTNLGPGEPDLMLGKPRGMTDDPQIENAWFRSYRIMLEPGQETPMQLHSNPSVVVQATVGKVHVSREDGITAELVAMGDWTWRAENGAYLIKNAGTEAVEVVVNEARR